MSAASPWSIRPGEAYDSLGAIALVRDADGEWITGSGAADVAGTTITENTRFRIASITKPIIAALVLDAVEPRTTLVG